ncbi:MAG: hypothetical protein K5867_10380, partial [Bacteroidales bacterium]|nr:hypothetical protein [Bacteroidales bacterium]
HHLSNLSTFLVLQVNSPLTVNHRHNTLQAPQTNIPNNQQVSQQTTTHTTHHPHRKGDLNSQKHTQNTTKNQSKI